MMSLISNAAGSMIPFEGPPDYALHNRGITPHFYVRRDPILDEKSRPVLDATGKPSELEIECCTISIAGDMLSEVSCLAVDGTAMSPHLRFAEAYARWKAGDETVTGTRLSDWGDPAMAESPEPAQLESRPDITRPPKRLPIRTKSRWQTLPPELREDIILREEEFDSAFKRYDGLGQYAMPRRMARRFKLRLRPTWRLKISLAAIRVPGSTP